MTKQLKIWVGNLDGSRRGLVIAPTKKRALEILGCGLTDFENYWHRATPTDEASAFGLEAEVLYTQKFNATPKGWYRGRCPL